MKLDEYSSGPDQILKDQYCIEPVPSNTINTTNQYQKKIKFRSVSESPPSNTDSPNFMRVLVGAPQNIKKLVSSHITHSIRTITYFSMEYSPGTEPDKTKKS